MKESYTAAIITVSDKGAQGLREDGSGKTISQILKNKGYKEIFYTIVPDEVSAIKEALLKSVKLGASLILTTGGTGFSKRDVTPEATRAVIEREAQGIAEAIRGMSLQITPRAMLSRGIAGITGNSLIINLPGSPKAVAEALGFILDSVGHGLDILTGAAHDCARTDK